MFRLFLQHKHERTFADDSQQMEAMKPSSAERKRMRNRRIFERFDVNHKHIAMMNDQDILVIKEISAKGMSAFVSERSFERFKLGDQYSAKIGYGGETFPVEVQVSWKEVRHVGFEIINAEKRVLAFLARLLRPMEIAQSMRLVETAYRQEATSDQTWYHGDQSSDLFVWRNLQQSVIAWQLNVADTSLSWSANTGFQTGVPIMNQNFDQLNASFPSNSQSFKGDSVIKSGIKQFGRDIILALSDPLRRDLLEGMRDKLEDGELWD